MPLSSCLLVLRRGCLRICGIGSVWGLLKLLKITIKNQFSSNLTRFEGWGSLSSSTLRKFIYSLNLFRFTFRVSDAVWVGVRMSLKLSTSSSTKELCLAIVSLTCLRTAIRLRSFFFCSETGSCILSKHFIYFSEQLVVYNIAAKKSSSTLLLYPKKCFF